MNVEAPGDSESLEFYQEELQTLRTLCERLSTELRLARRVLHHVLPPVGHEALPEVSAAVRLPAGNFAAGENDLRFTVDAVDRGPARTRVRGWAVATGMDCAAARILLMFAGTDGGLYAVPTERVERPDVSAAFTGTGWAKHPEHAGFVGTVFHPSLPPGQYELLLHVEQSGGKAARRATGVRVNF